MVSVIDDDAAVRKALSRLLRLHGFVPHLFASAEEFLESDDLQATSCIISDMRMPGMSGVELGAVLRDRGSDTPIIYMTAYREERERASAMQAVFLIKPFDPQQLLASVRAAIDHAPDAEPTLQ